MFLDQFLDIFIGCKRVGQVERQVEQFRDKVREARLMWFGHVQTCGYIGQDQVHGCSEEGRAEGWRDRVRLKLMMCCGDIESVCIQAV